jgi:hypothetical protein
VLGVEGEGGAGFPNEATKSGAYGVVGHGAGSSVEDEANGEAAGLKGSYIADALERFPPSRTEVVS